MCGSTSSTIDPAGVRSYFGGPSEAIAARTVFLETPNTRTIALIGSPSARCSLRISAQSSTAAYVGAVGVRFAWHKSGIPDEDRSQFFHFPHPVINWFADEVAVVNGNPKS
jgi:hypothetical protein